MIGVVGVVASLPGNPCTCTVLVRACVDVCARSTASARSQLSSAL